MRVKSALACALFLGLVFFGVLDVSLGLLSQFFGLCSDQCIVRNWTSGKRYESSESPSSDFFLRGQEQFHFFDGSDRCQNSQGLVSFFNQNVHLACLWYLVWRVEEGLASRAGCSTAVRFGRCPPGEVLFSRFDFLNQVTTVTWLILPVVICLSQRLSHACLSINTFVLWNCRWLIISVIVYLMANTLHG